jgi:hypothetical protein
MADTERKPKSPVWDGPNYAHVAPGRYSAIVTRIQGPEWCFQYRRWSLLVEFELLGEVESVRVCAFFNLGNDPAKLHAGRQSRYCKAWTIANGELPHRGQEMKPEVFMEGQIFEIEVDDSSTAPGEQKKTDAEVYSRVTALVSCIRPNPIYESVKNQESGIKNQESRITQAPNQEINQSS